MKSIPKKKIDAYKKHEEAEKKNGHAKMEMIEKAMHGKNAGKRISKNYKHQCSKGCNCN